jgi:hypothetical protein
MYEPIPASATPTQKQMLKKVFYKAVELQHNQIFAAAGLYSSVGSHTSGYVQWLERNFPSKKLLKPEMDDWDPPKDKNVGKVKFVLVDILIYLIVD